MKILLAGACLTGLLLGLMSDAGAAGALAFVTEVKGKATILRAADKVEEAKVGGQLGAGDKLRVDQGKAVLIYLSGRSVAVEEGKTHAVQQETGKPSPLMGRIKDTLDEIVGPGKEGQRPVVHGMARDLAGLSGALPANSRVSSADFAFTWDSLEGVAEYEFTLESAAGEVIEAQRVEGNRLKAGELNLVPGRRYVWKVEEIDSFLPRGSGKSWVLVAGKEDAEILRQTLKTIDEQYSGETQTLLKVTALFEGEFYYQAERLLVELQEKRALGETEQQILMAAYTRMGRLERLPAEDAPVTPQVRPGSGEEKK